MGSVFQAQLPDTLAQRVQFLRAQLDLTPNGLAKKAQVPLNLIEDVEAGLVLFMAPAVRQQVARALRVRIEVLAEVEKRPAPEEETDPGVAYLMKQRILTAATENPKAPLACPDCSEPLRIRHFERFDLEDNRILAVKVNCTRCLFRLESG